MGTKEKMHAAYLTALLGAFTGIVIAELREVHRGYGDYAKRWFS